MIGWVWCHFLSRTLSITLVRSDIRGVISDCSSFINDVSQSVSWVAVSKWDLFFGEFVFLIWVSWAWDRLGVGVFWFSEVVLWLG